MVDYVLLYLIAGLVLLATAIGRGGPFGHPNIFIVMIVHWVVVLFWPLLLFSWIFL